jgi:predicted DNA-binding transcriptional regulator AlpA
MRSGTAIPIQFPMEVLTARLDHLEVVVNNTARLHRKEVMQRYGVCSATFHRWKAKGKLPPPIGCGPLYRLADLEAYELAGRLPGLPHPDFPLKPPGARAIFGPVRLSPVQTSADGVQKTSGPNGVKRPGLL